MLLGQIGDGRLRAKLVLGCAGMGVCVTLLRVLGGHPFDALTTLVGVAAILLAMALGAGFARLIRERERPAEDLSERKRLEGEVRRAQKMDAIGRLAGGIANDFNNKLSIILGYSGIALDGMSAGDPMFVPFSEIKQAGERSAELTRQLLTLSRHQPQETRVLDVGNVVESMRRMFGRVLGDKIELTLLRDATPCTVEVPQGQLEQILTNLVVNARDAMPDGGTFGIDVRSVDITEYDAKKRVGMRSGRHVRLRVSDTGTGMSAETLERIFEPFFTTKDDAKREQGKGMGLGLSTVFGIVQQRSGHIRVDSEPGKGTTFEIHIPETKPRAPRLQESPSSGSTRAARTILVVENEEQVRHVVEQILRRHRYGVLVAESAAEALLICERHPGNIDLLVTDVILQEMNGPDLADQLHERRPDMKVLYMSGYTGDVDLLSGEDSEASAFLQKPVTPDTLRQKVRGILRSPLPSGPPQA
jgi:signal transduction histidine kinase